MRNFKAYIWSRNSKLYVKEVWLKTCSLPCTCIHDVFLFVSRINSIDIELNLWSISHNSIIHNFFFSINVKFVKYLEMIVWRFDLWSWMTHVFTDNWWVWPYCWEQSLYKSWLKWSSLLCVIWHQFIYELGNLRRKYFLFEL